MTTSDPPVTILEGGAFFELAQAPMALLDDDLRVRSVNAAWAAAAGKPRGALCGSALAAALPPGASSEQPFELSAEDGPPRWLRLDTQRAIGGVLATLVDVTTEQRQIRSLQHDHSIRDRLLEDAMVGAWRYDPDAELYHFATALDMGYGMNPTTPLAELMLIQHRDDQPIEAAHRERLTREPGTAEGETRYRHANGSWVHLHYRIRSGRRLPSGRYELYGLSQNVTPQALARDEAKSAAQRLRLALKGAGAAVFEYDFKTQRFWASPELAETADPERLKAAAADPLAIFNPEDWELISGFRRSAARGDSPPPIDVRLIAKQGDRWTRFYLDVEHRDGRPRRAVGLLLDIDEQKRQAIALAEARQLAEEATAAKSAFLASVSHEIRTPMNGIVGVLNLLKREPLSEEGRQLLAEALGCSDMLGQLINDVLDFSKIEAGKLEIDPVPCDPAQVALSVVNLIAPQATAKGLSLDTRIAGDIGWLRLDPVRLRQCLFNTLGNAVKFTDAGRIELRMGLTDGPDGPRLRCEVEDTGVGIPEGAQARLFDRFSQAEAGATTRRYGGTGLGLAISRTLARLMGGDMGFSSAEGAGSTFWFEVAAVPADEITPAEASDVADQVLTGVRLLIVDDNHVNRLVGVKTVEAMGAEATAVESGEAAIEAVRGGAFDLVLMDVNMPGMDGLEATGRIRQLPQPAAAVPIVAMTADVMAHHRERYAAAGMDGLVPKPFAPGQLLAEVVRLLAEPQPEASAAKASP